MSGKRQKPTRALAFAWEGSSEAPKAFREGPDRLRRSATPKVQPVKSSDGGSLRAGKLPAGRVLFVSARAQYELGFKERRSTVIIKCPWKIAHPKNRYSGIELLDSRFIARLFR
jgi:hypothetical protein